VIMHESGGWGPFPPIDVHRDTETDALYLSAGFQRTAAARMASDRLIADGQQGIDAVPVRVRPGGWDAALEFAEADNLEHGRPLSNRDKRHLFERRLARGHGWVQASDRAIARELGVDHKTVGNWRRTISTGENSPVSTTERVGSDGRTYNVSNIQEANRERAEPQRSEGPEFVGSAGEPAGRFGETPSGVANGTPARADAAVRRQVLAHLAAAVRGLNALNMADEADGLHDYWRDLADDWGM